MTQCTQVPRGASGSSQTRARLFVLGGRPDQDNAGEASAPSFECFSGIGLALGEG